MGARRMTQPTILNTTCDSASMSSVIGALCALVTFSAQPNEQRYQQGGQDRVAGDRAEQGVGDDVGDELDEADLLAGVDAGDLAGVQAGDVDVHAGAGFEDVGDDQPDQHRPQRQDEEVAQCLDADAAGFAQAVHGGDAEGDDAEHHGDDDHLDQADEPVVERAHGLADVGEQDADGDAEDGADDDLEPELADQGTEPGSPLWGGVWWLRWS